MHIPIALVSGISFIFTISAAAPLSFTAGDVDMSVMYALDTSDQATGFHTIESLDFRFSNDTTDDQRFSSDSSDVSLYPPWVDDLNSDEKLNSTSINASLNTTISSLEARKDRGAKYNTCKQSVHLDPRFKPSCSVNIQDVYDRFVYVLPGDYMKPACNNARGVADEIKHCFPGCLGQFTAKSGHACLDEKHQTPATCMLNATWLEFFVCVGQRNCVKNAFTTATGLTFDCKRKRSEWVTDPDRDGPEHDDNP